MKQVVGESSTKTRGCFFLQGVQRVGVHNVSNYPQVSWHVVGELYYPTEDMVMLPYTVSGKENDR